MNEPPTYLKIRLLYILHMGFVELRNLAQPDHSARIFDLADAMEILPRYLKDWNENSLEEIKSILNSYQEKYKGSRCFPYTEFLEAEDLPQF